MGPIGELMNSPAGRAVSAILKEQIADPSQSIRFIIWNLTLRLDSLARVECITNLSTHWRFSLTSEEIPSAYTVGDLVELANRKIRDRDVRRTQRLRAK